MMISGQFCLISVSEGTSWIWKKLFILLDVIFFLYGYYLELLYLFLQMSDQEEF